MRNNSDARESRAILYEVLKLMCKKMIIDTIIKNMTFQIKQSVKFPYNDICQSETGSKGRWAIRLEGFPPPSTPSNAELKIESKMI